MIKNLKNKGILLFVMYLCGAVCLYTPQAHAIAFIDSISGLLMDLGKKIMKDQSNEETSTSGQLEEQNAKTVKADDNEGKELFDNVLRDTADIAHDVAKGQYMAGDYSAQGFMEAFSSQLGDLSRTYDDWERKMNDKIESEEKAKMDKKFEMQKQMVVLQSQRDALNELIMQESTEDRVAQLNKLDEAIADLAKQIRENDEKDVMNTSEVRKAKREMMKLEQKMESVSAKYSEQNVANMMQTEMMKLFQTDPNKDEKEAYSTVISKLFLQEDESPNSENIRRIMNERKREYYDAVKNALETVVSAKDSIEQTNKRSEECTQMVTEQADGVLGSLGIAQCVEMQRAIVAVGYMEILLAMIQLDTTAEMQKWDNKYQLRDYEKDITKFNLDDYMMKKDDWKTSWRDKARERIKNGLAQHFSGYF